jgi:D-beta-D-heptose 7-phosphate kinase/D-beta-D-heptose 1-phosphate adenosyltransferase
MDSQPQKKLHILVIGDDCRDIYEYGTVDRISPEAPVPVFKKIETDERRGMAGNVCNNLVNLGCTVTFIHGEPSIKTRLIDMKSKQHIVRVDNDVYSTPDIELADLDLDVDAIVISDYQKGTVTYELIEELRKAYNGPMFVDTKKPDLQRFEGCFVKINKMEMVLSKSQPSELIVTLGENGVSYKDKWYPAKEIEVVDVTGAGDTFLAALAYSYTLHKDIDSAITFAIAASAVTVQHTGVYAPEEEEIKCD